MLKEYFSQNIPYFDRKHRPAKQANGLIIVSQYVLVRLDNYNILTPAKLIEFVVVQCIRCVKVKKYFCTMHTLKLFICWFLYSGGSRILKRGGGLEVVK